MMARTDACRRLLIGICLMVLFVPQHVFVLSLRPVVSITFEKKRSDANISDRNNVNITTSTEVAGSVDGFVGLLNGRSYLQFTLPKVNVFRFVLWQFSAEIRFLDTEVPNDRYSVLLGSLNISIGLIQIHLSKDYKLRVSLETFDERVILEMLYKKPGWKVLRLDYNPVSKNPSLRLKLKDSTGRIQTLSKHVTGLLHVPYIVLGAQEGCSNNFIGFMDHVKIWAL